MYYSTLYGRVIANLFVSTTLKNLPRVWGKWWNRQVWTITTFPTRLNEATSALLLLASAILYSNWRHRKLIIFFRQVRLEYMRRRLKSLTHLKTGLHRTYYWGEKLSLSPSSQVSTRHIFPDRHIEQRLFLSKSKTCCEKLPNIFDWLYKTN